MLRHLTIRDFVIVDHLELDFGAGFGALTGETGAGKSILLDALGLALGGKAESGVIRTGSARAEIVAEFDVPADGPLRNWLVEQALGGEDEVILLRRVLESSGRSKAWLNGTPVVLSQLRMAGDLLADIHGQHAHHALLRGDAQLALLDAHGGLQCLAREVFERYRDWSALRRARALAEEDASSSARERELLGWQVGELSDLAFDLDDWRALNQEQARLAHAASLIEGGTEVVEGLADGEYAVVPQLDRLLGRVAEMASHDRQLADVQELLGSASIQLDEAVHAMRRYRDRLDLDPERLGEIDQRIQAITGMARKYRVAPEDLPDVLTESVSRLERLTRQSDPAALARDEALAREAFMQPAVALSEARRKVAAELSSAVTEAMQSLAMSGACFEIALKPVEEGAASGLEAVEFLVTANASQPLRSMAKVASGGELSRIGLAIQVITSRSVATPTLIFDEVDVGIGGRVAEIVGRLLRQLGVDRQVLCVTHLPQVAAQADWQWTISKETREGETLSRVRLLDASGRIEEIARMLGGVNITDTTRRHAAEMLSLES
ncbi:DNA repair protein RecN [Zoogloea sp.]|jgi:DNA repair protein RecN (Recombination protein N)|uniref:DNA repair protein RecN n=1 Tax=Zoogloea sp. TaxID=49181 RepID=UPI0011DB428D|nr:DNA repair protein RecN [Zoogloea sp.]MBK7848308.1 DNA repair protein RecN [Zoogloea sp.]TXG88301.1 MAG: DNA repair protein RecN [Zoogloea sp.]HOX99959.1 DNA repair protein RecN [Zoogloea sp.]HPI58597.1 DNA repair protein RecN [Zoogloea sp.]